MNKLLLVLLPLVILTFNQPVLAAQKVDPIITQNVLTTQVQKKELDQRAQILRAYLSKYNAPLADSAQDFVEAADMYELDWKLVAAISGVESTFGKYIPGGTDPRYTSYNGWGWGVYGTQAIYFKSWKEGIYTVSEGLRKNYYNKGLTNPYSINKVYAASPTWGAHVSYFLADMDKFEAQYKKIHAPETVLLGLSTPVAGTSGQFRVNTIQLAYR